MHRLDHHHDYYRRHQRYRYRDCWSRSVTPCDWWRAHGVCCVEVPDDARWRGTYFSQQEVADRPCFDGFHDGELHLQGGGVAVVGWSYDVMTFGMAGLASWITGTALALVFLDSSQVRSSRDGEWDKLNVDVRHLAVHAFFFAVTDSHAGVPDSGRVRFRATRSEYFVDTDVARGGGGWQRTGVSLPPA
jgi:hypothetical protein